jgi:hypothetical protein
VNKELVSVEHPSGLLLLHLPTSSLNIKMYVEKNWEDFETNDGEGPGEKVGTQARNSSKNVAHQQRVFCTCQTSF